MPELAKAYVQIIPSAEGIQGQLAKVLDNEASAAGKSSGSKFSASFGSVAKTGLAAIGAVAGATVAAGGALLKGAADVAAYGDNIDKMSQKMGLSIEAYQEWDAIMQHSGTSIDSMQSSMKTLANAVENENEAFERLGLSQDAVAAMSNEDLFAATIAALQNVDNETERTYLAGQLLGRGATELGALLNMSAEETEEMRQRVHDLGGVMSDDAVKAAAAYQDSLLDMQTAFSGLSRGLLAEFVPGITGVMDGLTEIFSGNSSEGIGMISDGVASVVDTISGLLPEFLELGSSIIVSLAQAITDNLPTLLSSGADAVMTIAEGLIAQLPDIIATGLDVIVSLANGIAESLPTLIPTIVDVVLQIVDTLTDPETLGNLVDASIAIIIALAEGLINALPKLLEKAPQIIANLVTAIVQNVPKLLEASLKMIVELGRGIVQNLPQILSAGVQIVQTLLQGIGDVFSKMWEIGDNIVKGVWEGISGGYDWIKNKINGWVGDVVGFFKRVLGISSPSKVFAEMGGFMAAGVGVGIENNLGLVEQAVGDMSDAALDAWHADRLNMAVTGAGSYRLGSPGAAAAPGTGAGGVQAMAEAIARALDGCGVYMDGQTVGRLVTRAQANAARAYG